MIGASANAAITSSRVAFSAFTRKSSGAGVFSASAMRSVSASPWRATSISNSQDGRLARKAGGNCVRSISPTRCSHAASSSDSPPSASTPTASASPRSASRRIAGPWPDSAKLVYTDLLRSKP